MICADTARETEKLLPWGRYIAGKLRKGLILLTCSTDGKEWVDLFEVPHVAMPSEKGIWKKAIDGLPTVFNAVLAIAMVDRDSPRHCFTHPRQLLRNFKDCKVGYLVINSEIQNTDIEINNSFLTLNHQRESKEKLLWASYFTRFCGSRTVVMHYKYRDASFLRRWKNNIQYLDKLYGSLGLSYETMSLTGSELGNPDLTAIKNEAWKTKSVFIVLVADQREHDIGDLFITAPELRILRTSSEIPILFINQRDDIYILCD